MSPSGLATPMCARSSRLWRGVGRRMNAQEQRNSDRSGDNCAKDEVHDAAENKRAS
jgi:hypothetical protein